MEDAAFKPSLARPFEDVLITPVIDGPFFIAELFARKFGHEAPDFGHAVIAFWRDGEGRFPPMCYTNFLPHEGVILVGGAMTDGAVMRQLPADLSERIRGSGGIYFHVLKFAFDHFADDCEAFFGHAGDRRAHEVDLAAGFETTPHEHLIVNFHKPLPEARKQELITRIHALGAF